MKKPERFSASVIILTFLFMPLVTDQLNAQGNEKINAQSGLIDSNGERSLTVPDSGVQFFTVKIL